MKKVEIPVDLSDIFAPEIITTVMKQIFDKQLKIDLYCETQSRHVYENTIDNSQIELHRVSAKVVEFKTLDSKHITHIVCETLNTRKGEELAEYIDKPMVAMPIISQLYDQESKSTYYRFRKFVIVPKL